MGIPVTWGTLLVGFAEGHGVLTGEEFAAFAIERASQTSTLGSELVDAMFVNPQDDEAVLATLRVLCEIERPEMGRETRKWRLLLVEDRLADLPSDPVDGLFGLTEFWSGLDFPPDSPHVVQGRGNTIDPVEYYTDATLVAERERHRMWVERERADLARFQDRHDRG